MATNKQGKRLGQILHAGNTPQTWRSTADDLSAGARILADAFQQHAGFMKEAQSALGDGASLKNEVRTISLEGPFAVVHGHSQWRTAFLLYGMAFECLLKARCLEAGIRLVGDEGVLAKRFKKHALRDLALEAQIKLSDREARLLDVLGRYVVWAGRYPIPKDADSFKDEGGFEGLTLSEILKAAPDLYQRLGESGARKRESRKDTQ